MNTAANDPSAVARNPAARVGRADALAHWLLRGPAQIIDGPEAGGVAGIVDADGSAAYVYPEITGYYLQWLAWRAARHGIDAELASRAQRAQRWLGTWLGARAPPLTRVHLRPVGDDWRNDAVFLFDVAMVLRGLGSAARVGLLEPVPGIVAGVCAELDRLVDADGHFAACVSHRNGALSARWSTRRGAFLAKAAAGILDAATALGAIPARLVAAAANTYGESLRLLDESPHAEAHPLLYAFEGVLSLPADPALATMLPLVATQFDALLAESRRHGRVPEFLRAASGEPGAQRMDIVAQTVRVGVLVAAHRPQDRPDPVELERLRQLLMTHLTPEGAVPFAIDEQPLRHNVWATMFADQALVMANDDDRARSVELDARLVV